MSAESSSMAATIEPEPSVSQSMQHDQGQRHQGQQQRWEPMACTCEWRHRPFVCLMPSCHFTCRIRNELLTHLFDRHNVIIADDSQIIDIAKYVMHYRHLLDHGKQLRQIAAIVSRKPSKPPSVTAGASQDEKPAVKASIDGHTQPIVSEAYLLGGFGDDDADLRTCINKQCLEELLVCQRKELSTDDNPAKCLFCPETLPSLRDGLNHMHKRHGFSVGLPENLVHVREFYNQLQTSTEDLTCLACDKSFPDIVKWKTHLRKKRHYQLNPNCHEYDKYYLVTYTDPGRDWKDIAGEADEKSAHDYAADSSWDDWTEVVDEGTKCLICDTTLSSAAECWRHLSDIHCLPLLDWMSSLSLNFHERVCFVNFARQSQRDKRCFVCGFQMDKDQEQSLAPHFQEKHMNDVLDALLPQRASWSKPNFLRPVFEDDPLLLSLDDDDDSDVDAGDE